MNDTIKVWDPLVRVFHWSLAAGFFTAYLTADEWRKLHVYAGYLIAGLVAFRVVWGLVGSRHARFTDFVAGPKAVGRYLLQLLQGRSPRYLGHNPAGGAMVVALLVFRVPFGFVAQLGDIAIAWETCAAEAEAQAKPMADHVAHLIVHGVLHLLGYDHIEDEDAALMEGLEVRILASLGVSDPY